MANQEFKSKVGKRLQEMRTAFGYTQKYLAQQLRVSVSTYRNWELGVSISNINNYYILVVKIYKMTLQDFFAPCR